MMTSRVGKLRVQLNIHLIGRKYEVLCQRWDMKWLVPVRGKDGTMLGVLWEEDFDIPICRIPLLQELGTSQARFQYLVICVWRKGKAFISH